MQTTMRRRQQAIMAALAACVACLALARGSPVASRSFLGQLMPFSAEELNEFFRQTGNVVDTLSQGASYAFEELAGSLDDLGGSLGDLASSLSNGPLSREALDLLEEDEPKCQPDGHGNEWCAPYDPDAKRNVSQIIESRGFRALDLEVTTRDGYILTIQRIINPEVAEADRKRLKPVILQHGLMSSSVDWVINSVDVKPARWPRAAPAAGNSIEEHQRARRATFGGDTQQEPNSLGFYLANEGYDVFLANSRGNIYGQKHVNMSSWQPKFWDFTFDEQIKYDLPDVIAFVQRLTGHKKVGYVGHSQGTTMALGLLADQPDYADVLEPVVLLAPVAYVNHCLSPVKYFAVYTPLFQHLNMWFGSSNVAVRYLAPKVCSPKVIRKEICANIIFLSCGFDEAEFNQTRVSAYLSHMPSGTSVKNIAHWGQEVLSGRFAHFDHGILGNQARYGSAKSPDYDLSKVRSKSIALFAADNDWLASPKDVERLKRELGQPPFKVVNVTEFMPAWNHIDFVYGKDCGRLVNPRIVDVFHHFD